MNEYLGRAASHSGTVSMYTKLILATAMLSVVAFGQAPAAAETPAAASQGCTWETLSATDKQRYQSRYRRRVRLDGQAFADRWLYEHVCMTAEERKAQDRAQRGDDEGRNCRAVSRPVTSMDGSMTVGIGRKCD